LLRADFVRCVAGVARMNEVKSGTGL
jgi:hypothetical protein